MSKFSFQYGFRVRFMTLVEWVCSASTVMTAKGSGSLKTSRLDNPSAATTAIDDRSAPIVLQGTLDGSRTGDANLFCAVVGWDMLSGPGSTKESSSTPLTDHQELEGWWA